MIIASRARTVVGFVLLLFAAEMIAAHAQVSVTTWHYDNARTGANPKESILNTSNVNSTQFGKLYTRPVDGAVVGQALYLPSITIPGVGVHNVVYVATMNDSVYAFDADNATGNNATPLWHTNFLTDGATAVPVALQGCGGTTRWTTVGILSTPVIDPVAGTIFVVAKTYENHKFVHRLHALDVSTGKEKSGSPVVMSGTFQYAGKGINFEDAMQVNRPALLLEKGNLYIAFGSNGCRGDKEQGWVMAYTASHLQPQGAFDDEPDESAAAIWMRGGGLSADTAGNIYGSTADGNFAAGTNFGQSVIKLAQAGGELGLADWFTPYNELYLEKHDLDMSEPVLILPYQSGKYHHLLAAVGKEGTIYILNRDNMGHFCATCTQADTQVVEELPAFAPETGALVYWNSRVYVTGTAKKIAGLSLTNGVLAKTPFAQSAATSQGNSPILTSNGNTGGILWTAGHSLMAYDALTLAKIYSSVTAANNRDALPQLPHFANLVVANGRVYIGSNNSLVVFGLF